MSTSRSMAAAIAGLLPSLTMAQALPPHPSPADPTAPITKQAYESAFLDYQRFTEPAQAPATQWRAANDEMGRLRGHAGHMKEAGDGMSDTGQPSGSHHGHGGK